MSKGEFWITEYIQTLAFCHNQRYWNVRGSSNHGLGSRNGLWSQHQKPNTINWSLSVHISKHIYGVCSGLHGAFTLALICMLCMEYSVEYDIMIVNLLQWLLVVGIWLFTKIDFLLILELPAIIRETWCLKVRKALIDWCLASHCKITYIIICHDFLIC